MGSFCFHHDIFPNLLLQVVPNSRSRSQIGETTTDGGLYEIFQQDYGPVGSPGFQSAHENFIISSAGYVVASLLLQLKDRHNGNILIDRFSPQNDMLFCIKLSRSKWWHKIKWHVLHLILFLYYLFVLKTFSRTTRGKCSIKRLRLLNNLHGMDAMECPCFIRNDYLRVIANILFSSYFRERY